ncbi:hypothetical protein ANN_00801 [Periplaneta americana]|uniref:Uncharacterized protein n=1 Tax=Periplaneta americana TaxID=6978 RepID=A0ABQ8TUN4_PERAM|nr:hypothetical protein ANN_00801 [Periplaneta americana]
MAGLFEGGNEPAGSLKAICKCNVKMYLDSQDRKVSAFTKNLPGRHWAKCFSELEVLGSVPSCSDPNVRNPEGSAVSDTFIKYIEMTTNQAIEQGTSIKTNLMLSQAKAVESSTVKDEDGYSLASDTSLNLSDIEETFEDTSNHPYKILNDLSVSQSSEVRKGSFSMCLNLKVYGVKQKINQLIMYLFENV